MRHRIHDPVEHHDTGTIIAASLVLIGVAVALVLTLQSPEVALLTAATLLVGTRLRRAPAHERSRRRTRSAKSVCDPNTGTCIGV